MSALGDDHCDVVTLEWGDVMIGAHVGIMRRVSAIFKNRAGMYGAATRGQYWWGIEIESALAELAVSRFLNLSWEGAVGNTKAVDVGGLVQVRSVDSEHKRLMLHSRDKDNEPFMLVRVAPPKFFMVGWCFAKDGKRAEFWETKIDPHTGADRSAYFVSQSVLRPAQELKTLIPTLAGSVHSAGSVDLARLACSVHSVP